MSRNSARKVRNQSKEEVERPRRGWRRAPGGMGGEMLVAALRKAGKTDGARTQPNHGRALGISVGASCDMEEAQHCVYGHVGLAKERKN